MIRLGCCCCNVAPVITHGENVEANVVTHDSVVVTYGETIVINETHITPSVHSLNHDTLGVHTTLRIDHAPYT